MKSINYERVVNCKAWDGTEEAYRKADVTYAIIPRTSFQIVAKTGSLKDPVSGKRFKLISFANDIAASAEEADLDLMPFEAIAAKLTEKYKNLSPALKQAFAETAIYLIEKRTGVLQTAHSSKGNTAKEPAAVLP